MSEYEDMVLLPAFLTGMALAIAELLIGGHANVAHATLHLVEDAGFAAALGAGWALLLRADETRTFVDAALAGTAGVIGASLVLLFGLAV